MIQPVWSLLILMIKRRTKNLRWRPVFINGDILHKSAVKILSRKLHNLQGCNKSFPTALGLKCFSYLTCQTLYQTKVSLPFKVDFGFRNLIYSPLLSKHAVLHIVLIIKAINLLKSLLRKISLLSPIDSLGKKGIWIRWMGLFIIITVNHIDYFNRF